MYKALLIVTLLCTGFIPISVHASNASSIIESASNAYDVPPALIAALIQNESGFNPAAFNDGDHVGLGQIGGSTVDASIIQVSCDQAGGPHLCDRTTCDASTGRCDVCAASGGSTCVQDERFDIEKNIRNTASAFKSKSTSIQNAGCRLDTEAGVKAAVWAYNTGHRPVVYAIGQVGDCSSYATIWQHARASFTPSSPGSNDGTIYPGAPGGGWSMTLAKLNNKDDSDPSSYVSKIYADYLRYGGNTPNDVFRNITIGAGSVQAAAPFSIDDILLQQPRPQIKIPGLSFSSTEDRANLINEHDGGITVNIPFLGEYIAAVYRLAIGVGSVVAIIIIIVSGIQMMLPGNIVTSDDKTTNRAKQQIIAAITGLVLAYGSYTILFIINPELVSLSPLRVQFIKPEPLELEIIAPIAGTGKWPEGVSTSPRALPIDFTGNPIEPLIGAYPGIFERCSAEGLRHTFEELDALNICVGPCHCAYTASHILDYAGCNIPYEGGAGALVENAKELGWREIPAKDATDDMFGLLAKKCTSDDKICHVGVYGGANGANRYQFDSGSGGSDDGGNNNYESRVGNTCPTEKEFWNLDPNTPGQNCVECSLIPSHAPITGNFGAAYFNQPGQPGYGAAVQGTNGGDTCRGTQIWMLRDYDADNWTYLYVPNTYSGCDPTVQSC